MKRLICQELLMAAEESGELLFVDLSGGVYPNAECLAVFAVLSLFLGNRFCRFEYDMVISGRQSVEIAENCDGFVANTKRKFLSYSVIFPII